MQEEASEFAAFVGIDWADRKHDICLQVPGADSVERLGPRAPPARPSRPGPTSCASASPAAASPSASSSPSGPIVSALLEHDFFVIFPVNPSTLAKYRTRVHSESRQGRPDRRRDRSRAPASATPRSSSRLRHESPNMRALRRLVEARRDLVAGPRAASPTASRSRSRPISRRFSTGFATKRPKSSPRSSNAGPPCPPRSAPVARPSSTSSTPTASAAPQSSIAASTPSSPSGR